MKICLVNLGALPALSEEHKHEPIGGEEVQHAQLAVALKRLGHDVRLVVADLGQPDGAVYAGVQTLKAFRQSAGLPGLRFVYPRWVKLWSALERADADVYYCSTASMQVGLLAMFCKQRRRRLVFRTASASDCEPENLLIRYWRDRRLYEYGLRRADAVLVQTVSQQRALAENYGLSSTVADMLVERPLMTQGAPRKEIDVLWVANLRHVKRPDRLIELARSMPHYRFHMAGGPSAGEEDLYRHIADAARGVANLTFHGRVPYLDVGSLFDRARLFINTSDLEGFPNTFLQAWIRGIPVVTLFDPDAVVRQEGLGSSHSTLPDMVEGIEMLLRSDEAYRAASDAAFDFMVRRFGADSVLQPYLDAFLGASPRPRTQSLSKGSQEGVA